MNDSRYPYTYAADLIRSIPGRDGLSCKLSRSEASRIRQLFAKILDMDDEDLAMKLADYYVSNQQDLTDKQIQEILHENLKKGEV